MYAIKYNNYYCIHTHRIQEAGYYISIPCFLQPFNWHAAQKWELSAKYWAALKAKLKYVKMFRLTAATFSGAS
jgi:hypothetical protein